MLQLQPTLAKGSKSVINKSAVAQRKRFKMKAAKTIQLGMLDSYVEEESEEQKAPPNDKDGDDMSDS